MTILNHALAKSAPFKERLKDRVFGVYRDEELRRCPAFFDPPLCDHIELGYTDVKEQLAFMAERPATRFFLSVDGTVVDIAPVLSDLAALPNVCGIGGPGLTLDVFERFETATDLRIAEKCDAVDLSKFPCLRVLSYGSDAQPVGLAGCAALEELHIAGAPRRSFDLSGLRALEGLTSFSMTYGQFDDLSVLAACIGLRNLHIDPATRITRVAPLAHLPRLEVLSLFDAKNVEDWENFPVLEQLKALFANKWGKVTLPAALQPIIEGAELRSFGTRLDFA